MADTGFKSPSVTGTVHNDFGTPTNLFASDGLVSNASSGIQDLSGFSAGVPENQTIIGIEVTVEAKASAGTDFTDIRVSNDGGASFSDAKQVGHTTVETIETAGGSEQLWGKTWTVTQINSIMVSLEQLSAGTTIYDHVQVKIYFAAVTSGVGSRGTKWIKTKYPVEKGLIAATTSQTGRVMNLVPQGLNGVKSTVAQRFKDGI